jgi:hypothetical protein
VASASLIRGFCRHGRFSIVFIVYSKLIFTVLPFLNLVLKVVRVSDKQEKLFRSCGVLADKGVTS